MTLLSTIAAHFKDGFAVGLKERTRRIAGGLLERQATGRFVGRIPFGYRRRLADFADGTRGWDGGLEVEPTEAAGVRWAFGEWIGGASRRDIAAGLNARGHRTRIGRSWSARAVKVMLHNPVYTGRLVRYRRRHPDHYFPEAVHELGRPFPPIVTDEQFDIAQARDGWPVRPTAWSRRLAAMAPDRLAELRARHRETARRHRERTKTNPPEHRGDTDQ